MNERSTFENIEFALFSTPRCFTAPRWRSKTLHQCDEELRREEVEQEASALSKKISMERQQAWNRDRTDTLGENPREVRAALRAALQPGFVRTAER